jgi:hypothetical protein
MDGIGPLANYSLQMADLRRVANPTADVVDSPAEAVKGSDQKKQQVAKDFESVLLTRLFEQVHQTMGVWETEEDGTAKQVQGLFWLYLARDTADKGGIGLWKEIYQHIQQMDGVPNPADALDEEL